MTDERSQLLFDAEATIDQAIGVAGLLLAAIRKSDTDGGAEFVATVDWVEANCAISGLKTILERARDLVVKAGRLS